MPVASPWITCPIAMGNVYIGIFLLASCLISIDLAQPVGPVLAYQDSLGQYSFGYSAPGSARSEIRTIDGETRGAYSYIDDAGVIHSAHYTADGKHGFRVAATNLPQAPLQVQSVQASAEEETVQAGKTIGEGNIFLKGLDENLQAKEKGEVVERKLMDIGEKENADGTLKSTSEVASTESQAGVKVSQSEHLERSKISNSEQIIETLKQSGIPVLRISQDDLSIYPAISQETINVQGSSITPESTVLKSSQEVAGKIAEASSKGLTVSAKEQSTDSLQEIIAPVRILPVNPAYPTLLRYTDLPTLHYVFYNHQ